MFDFTAGIITALLVVAFYVFIMGLIISAAIALAPYVIVVSLGAIIYAVAVKET